jgi:glucosyl-dolichyl phosphate glucuronosyltransferase
VTTAIPRFSVVIPTMSRPEPLRRTLESVRQTKPGPLEVLVIDSDEGASARELVMELQDGTLPMHHVHAEPSLTKQRNLAIDRASGDVVVFLDDDVSLPKNLFARLEQAYADESVVGATGWVVEPESRLRRGGPSSFLRRVVLRGSRGKQGTFTRFGYPRYVVVSDRPCDVEFMPGCFMSARRTLASKVRFDEQLGAYALGEDEDFSYRLSRHGRIVHLPDLVAVHEKLGFRSFDSRDFGRLVVRNRAYLFRKNFPQTVGARAQFGVLLAMLVVHRLLNREWHGALGVLEGTVDLVRGRTRLSRRGSA